jgi:DNA sulfur modification protein DndD
MILERLVLENFRQFKGRQEIIFAEAATGRNVTLIHAENGFGKTTLLNAILWVLYGHEALTEDFEDPDKLIHEGTMRSTREAEEVAAQVELTFQHEGNRYIATRRLSLPQQSLDYRKAKLSLTLIHSGQTFNENSPQQKLRKIIPPGIRDFLFFNGENINQLAMQKNAAAVRDAIEEMLGLKLLRITIDDLLCPSVKGKFDAELRDETSDEKAALLDQQLELEEKLQKLKNKLNQIITNITASDAAVKDIDNQLALNRHAAELQARRDQIQQEQKGLIDKRDELERKLARLIAEDGYALFARDLVARGREIMAELRSQGKIPARVLNEFLRELLDQHKCICKRDLDEETPHREAVEALMQVAGDQAFNNNVGKLDHAIGLIEGVAQQTETLLQDLNRQRLEAIDRIKVIEGELNDIHAKIGNKEDNTVKELEERRRQHEIQKGSDQAAKGRTEGEIEAVSHDLESNSKRIDQIAETEADAIIARDRKKAVEDCAQLLQKILDAETRELRPLLSEEINKHYRSIINRNYFAELREDFTLAVNKVVAGADGNDEELSVAKNQALRQTLSLIFIASLVALAARRKEIPTIMRDLSGEIYPIVMDSPFGALDGHYSKGVAKWIPLLAQQVGILINYRHFEGAVETALKEGNRIGRRYYLEYHGPKPPNDPATHININGQDYQIFFEQPEEEITNIIEVQG